MEVFKKKKTNAFSNVTVFETLLVNPCIVALQLFHLVFMTQRALENVDVAIKVWSEIGKLAKRIKRYNEDHKKLLLEKYPNLLNGTVQNVSHDNNSIILLSDSDESDSENETEKSHTREIHNKK